MEARPLNSLTLEVVLSFVKKKKYDLHFVWIERKMEGMNVAFMTHGFSLFGWQERRKRGLIWRDEIYVGFIILLSTTFFCHKSDVAN